MTEYLVDPNGPIRTIQEALDKALEDGASDVAIRCAPGKYREPTAEDMRPFRERGVKVRIQGAKPPPKIKWD